MELLKNTHWSGIDHSCPQGWRDWGGHNVGLLLDNNHVSCLLWNEGLDKELYKPASYTDPKAPRLQGVKTHTTQSEVVLFNFYVQLNIIKHKNTIGCLKLCCIACGICSLSLVSENLRIHLNKKSKTLPNIWDILLVFSFITRLLLFMFYCRIFDGTNHTFTHSQYQKMWEWF